MLETIVQPGEEQERGAKRRLVTLVAIVGVLVATLFVPATAASAQSSGQNIRGSATQIRAYGKCVTNPQGWWGGSLHVATCNGNQNQWMLATNGQIRLNGGSYCMKVGYYARMDRCDSSSLDQKFWITLGGEIISRRTKQCMAVGYGISARFEECNGRGRQRWALPGLPNKVEICSGGVIVATRVITSSRGFRVSVVPRDFNSRQIGWNSTVRCMDPFYKQSIFRWDIMTPGLRNLYNQAECHAVLDPIPFVNAGPTWDYESYNDLGRNRASWIATRCGNASRPSR